VGGFGIVGLKDGAAVDQDLPDGRVQHGGERLPAAVLDNSEFDLAVVDRDVAVVR